MPAVSKKQQRYFGYLLSNPEERKKKGISKKDATDFAQHVKEGEIADKLRKVVADMKAADRKAGLLPGGKDVIDLSVERERRRKKKLDEVSPPGWGHTKAEKEKTKPDKPKSKIGGSAAAFKRALDDGRFKGLPGSTTKKEKTADMFKLMWSMKKKGDKPHYKPGTDKKYKKYQEEVKASYSGSSVSFGQFYNRAKEAMADAKKQKEKAKKNKEQSERTREDTRKHGIKFTDSKGSGRIKGGKKVYD